MSRIALVIVSHSATLAEGVREVANALAPEVHVLPAGGTQTFAGEGLGTSVERVEAAVLGSLEVAEGVVVLTDIGSSKETVETVLDKLKNDNVCLVDAPIVEGAVAAALSSQMNGDLNDVRAAAAEAGAQFVDQSIHARGTSALDAAFVEAPEGSVAVADDSARAVAVVGHDAGLHARPAALIAGLANTYSSLITIDGVDACSALEIMGRSIRKGQTVIVEARGADAIDAVIAVVKGIEKPEALG